MTQKLDTYSAMVRVSRTTLWLIVVLMPLGHPEAKEPPAQPTDRLTAPHRNIERARPGAYRYTLAGGKDSKLCPHMLELVNEDLAKYGYEQFDLHSEFTRIIWRDVRFHSEVGGQRRTGEA